MTVFQSDIYVEYNDGKLPGTDPKGVNLYVRKKDGVESVLLVETSTDPEGKMDNYAYRAEQFNPVNGHERRLLNGNFLESRGARYSLVSSTVTKHPKLGDCFLIYIPPVIIYGYPWERHGSVTLGKGTFVNVRTFQKKYADYTGRYKDNPFVFDFNSAAPNSKELAEQKKKWQEAEEEAKRKQAELEAQEAERRRLSRLANEEAARKRKQAIEEEMEARRKQAELAQKEAEQKRLEEERLREEEARRKQEELAQKEAERKRQEKLAQEEAERKKEEARKAEEEAKRKQEELAKKEKESVELVGGIDPKAAKKFKEISNAGGGLLTYSKGPQTLTKDLVKLMDSIEPKDKVDIVFAVDTTGSMRNDMKTLRAKWVPELRKQLREFKDIRMGLLCYRDYKDDYSLNGLPVKMFNFTSDVDTFVKYLNTPVIRGLEGGDVPEAVYEALYASIYFYKWRDDAQKVIILIGDAEPHRTPRGPKKITQKTVTEAANRKGIKLNCIIVPNTK
ncbi:MAG: VWA domain-containing protein [Treponema sp.]|nr:VWA domain-containing protein [Treponema sp.]